MVKSCTALWITSHSFLLFRTAENQVILLIGLKLAIERGLNPNVLEAHLHSVDYE